MKNKLDYYAVLGVSKDGTDAEIKSAYRKLARKYHPDQNPDNPEEANLKFNELKEAYDVLSNSQKRADYDQIHGAYSSAKDTKPRWNPSDPQKSHGSAFDDLFGSGFASYFKEKMESGGSGVAGENVAASIQISHSEAASGAKKELSFDFSEVCGHCSGTGSVAAAKSPCENCGGSGMERVITRSGFGKITRNQQCSVCHGKGYSTQGDCSICSGSGFVKINKKIMLEIPKGIKNGGTISLKGLGQPSKHGGTRGNLVVSVFIR